MKPSLSPRELAEAIGASESSLKRWADEGRIKIWRTAGGHRRIQISEAIRYIREAGVPVLNPAALGLSDVAAAVPALRGDSDPCEALYRALLDNRGEVARGLVLSQYLEGRPLPDLFDHLLAGAMHRIGELWAHDSVGIAIEHRAIDLCIQTVNQLRSLVPPAPVDAPLAMGGAPSGDPYILPSLMAATLLAGLGYREMNLGADLPLDVLAQAAARHRPAVVWLSVSAPQPVEEFVGQTVKLAELLNQLQARLFIGGRFWPPRLRLKAPNAHYVADMAQLHEHAAALKGRD